MISFLQCNCKGVYTRRGNLDILIEKLFLVVIALQETWLRNKNKFNKREYQILRQDRKANDGRGEVLLMIQQNVAYTRIQL